MNKDTLQEPVASSILAIFPSGLRLNLLTDSHARNDIIIGLGLAFLDVT